MMGRIFRYNSAPKFHRGQRKDSAKEETAKHRRNSTQGDTREPKYNGSQLDQSNPPAQMNRPKAIRTQSTEKEEPTFSKQVRAPKHIPGI